MTTPDLTPPADTVDGPRDYRAELDEVHANVSHGEARYNPWALAALNIAEALLVERHRLRAEMAERGALMPTGGETREEWGVNHPRFGIDGPVRAAREFHGETDESVARRLVRGSDNLTLVRRTITTYVLTGPWREVEQHG